MGWLWVEGTPMRLALRALNLRQAEPSICQPHALALGFTLSDSKDDPLATFWTDTEPTWWSWVRAIAAEIVRQTPFRAQRCLNFLGILTTCPRGPVPLPDSPTEQRRRSRSELRYWPTADLSIEKISPDQHSPSILEESRRRARSELRAWSSSNTSSDEDLLLGGSVTAANVTGGGVVVGVVVSASGGVHNSSTSSRAWGCSESSEGSDDSLPWGAGGPCCRSSVDSVDSAISLSEPSTREQRMQRYKEARRRENEARRRQVLEEDARRRWANKAVGPCVNTLATTRKSEENNNHNDDEGVDSSYRASRHRRSSSSKATRTRLFANVDDHDDNEVPLLTSPKTELTRVISSSSSSSSSTSSTNSSRIEDAPGSGKYSSPVKPQTDTCSTVRFENTRQQQYDDNWNNNNNNNSNNKNHSSNKNSDSVSRNNQLNSSLTKLGILKTDAALERRSRARERRNVRDKGPQLSLPAVVASAKPDVETLKERKERLNSTTAAIARSTTVSSSSAVATKLPEIPMECCISQQQQRQEQQYRRSVSLSVLQEQQPPPCEEDVARLLKRCQRVDHYVPVRDKLTLFESLTRMAGRLARSTEDLCRTCNSSNPSPKGKQRARSLHDLNRGGVKLVPVREMCRFFENGKASSYTSVANATLRKETTRGRPCELGAPINGAIKSFREPPRNPNAPCIRTSTRRKHYAK
ncbi:probable myosin light chain kinase DDB_G0279831 isoform X2 [Copidosoma floridanum]|nr:probable myosin light chain kinase DDB_G0279831 isoform X2 [Copidosoma floridanum]